MDPDEGSPAMSVVVSGPASERGNTGGRMFTTASTGLIALQGSVKGYGIMKQLPKAIATISVGAPLALPHLATAHTATRIPPSP